MTKRSYNLKLAALIPVLLLTVLSVSVVYGGLWWSGIDPEISLDDHTLNVTAQWRSEDLCAADGPITIDVYHPAKVTAVVVSESSDSCVNADGETVILSTVTNTHATKSKKVKVTGTINSSQKMRARLLVELDGKKIQRCKGKTNKLIKCKKFKLK
jgi:hypothetical protein